MDYVKLGTTGLKVSRICLGMMTYGTPSGAIGCWTKRTAARSSSARWNSASTSSTPPICTRSASAKKSPGRALRDFARRDEVIIATKVFNPMSDDSNARGLSRKHIMDAIDASLRRLGTDYVDLYQIHRWDYDTPIEETMEALHDVVKAGKARYIGASSMFAWQFAKTQYTADLHGWTRFVSMQNHYNLVYREEEREMIPLCVDQGIGLIPWSPLARGFLAGNRTRAKSGDTTRSKSDDFAHQHVLPRGRFRDRGSRGGAGRAAGPQAVADRAGLDAA